MHVDNYSNNVRAALLVRNTLQAWRVDILCTPDITVAAIVVNKKVIYVASVYCDIDIEMQIVLGKLLQYCNTHKVPLLMGMDSQPRRGTRLQQSLISQLQTSSQMILM